MGITANIKGILAKEVRVTPGDRELRGARAITDALEELADQYAKLVSHPTNADMTFRFVLTAERGARDAATQSEPD